MSTFSEYLEKTATQAKKETDEKIKEGKIKPKFRKPTRENQGLKNTKIAGGDEVVNEEENLVEYQCDLIGGDYVEIYLPENATEAEIRNKAIEEASNNLKLEEYRKRPIKNRQ